MTDSVPATGTGVSASQRPGGAESLLGTTIAGRYKIESILGEGGMGTVYGAEHTLMRKRVALKVLHPHMSRMPEIVARFEREALAAAHIDHPNIAAATDFGQLPDGSFFLVLELVVGESLSDVVGRGPVEVSRAVHIATQIASALGRAHGLGVVHRDLKPDNVMLVARGADKDFVKVLDFGIAKVPLLEPGGPPSSVVSSPMSGPQKALTQAGMVYGTPAYMAPEQALGQPVDGRADLYAVGVLLFEMLTGKRPFRHDNMATLLGLQVTAPIPSMAEAAPEVRVPSALEAVTRRLMAKDPAQRFATAEELATALEKSVAVVLPAEPSGAEKLMTPAGVAAVGPENPASASAASAQKGSDLDSKAAAVTRVDTPGKTDLAAAPMRTPPPAPTSGVPRRHWLVGGGVVVVVGLLASLAIPRSETPGVAVAPSSMPESEPPPVASASAATPTPSVATPTPSSLAPSAEPPPEDRLARPLASAEAALAKNEPSVALGIIAPLEAANATRADVHRILERAYAMSHDRVAALREADAWLVNDPTAAADLSLQTDIGEIATHPTTSDAAIALLASRLGAPGVDILYDLAFASKQRPMVAVHAAAMLEKAEVRSHAGPAAAVLLDLRAATTCEARRALLPRVKSDGDRRALAILKPWTTNRKEAGCMRHDPDLANAIQAVSGRSGML